jgi:hypothetical protein
MAYAKPAYVCSGPSDAALTLSGGQPIPPSSGTIDGVPWGGGGGYPAWTAGVTRVLLLNQAGSFGAAAASNGVWIWQGANPTPMTRPAPRDEYATGNALDNATLVEVRGPGTSFGGTCYGVEPAGPITVDTTAFALTRVALSPVQARVVSTSNLSSLASVTTIDGVTLQGDGNPGSDLVLVAGQLTPSQNGIYWANPSGTMQLSSEPHVPHRLVSVSEGAQNAHTLWVLVTRLPINLGTTSLTFSPQDLVLNVRDFGAIGDGNSHQAQNYHTSYDALLVDYPFVATLVSNPSVNWATVQMDWLGIQAAVNYAASSTTVGSYTVTGNRVQLPRGIYLCDQPITANESYGVTVEGPSGISGPGIGQGAGVLLEHTGSGPRFIDARSSFGFTLRGLTIMYSSAFTGALVDFTHDSSGRDATSMTIDQCQLMGDSTVATGTGANPLINLPGAIGGTFTNLQLGNAYTAVRFKQPISEFASTAAGPTFTYNQSAKSIQRSSGSWITDGWGNGATIGVAGSTAITTNGALGSIESITTTTNPNDTITVSTSFTVSGGSGGVNSDTTSSFNGGGWDDFYSNTHKFDRVLCMYHAYSFVNAGQAISLKDIWVEGTTGHLRRFYRDEYPITQGAAFTFTAGGNTVVRSGGPEPNTQGSWIDDGWQVGSELNITNTLHNNGGPYLVTLVSDETLTVSGAVFGSGSGSPEISTTATLTDSNYNATSQACEFTYSGNTITRTGGSWIADGWFPGADAAIVHSSISANNSESWDCVASVTATTLTFSDSVSFTSGSDTSSIIQLRTTGDVLTIESLWAGDQFQSIMWCEIRQNMNIVSVGGMVAGGATFATVYGGGNFTLLGTKLDTAYNPVCLDRASLGAKSLVAFGCPLYGALTGVFNNRGDALVDTHIEANGVPGEPVVLDGPLTTKGVVGVRCDPNTGVVLDINGSTAHRHYTLSSLRSGSSSSPPNVKVNVNGHSYVEITAPTTAQFYISGIAGGKDGYVLELFNATGQTGTFNNNDTSHETTPNLIFTSTGKPVSFTWYAKLIWSTAKSGWILVSAT